MTTLSGDLINQNGTVTLLNINHANCFEWKSNYLVFLNENLERTSAELH